MVIHTASTNHVEYSDAVADAADIPYTSTIGFRLERKRREDHEGPPSIFAQWE